MTVKDDLLNTNRPLSDKIGSNAWGWDTKREIIESVHEAQLRGLKYLRYPYIISRTITTYTSDADTWRYGLKAILDAGIVPIVDFCASNNDAIPSGVVPDATISYFQTIIEDVIIDNKGKGIVWESWNEAIGNFWSKTPSTPEVMKQITDMNKFIADTVKTNDPDSAFIGPSLDTKQAKVYGGYARVTLQPIMYDIQLAHISDTYWEPHNRSRNAPYTNMAETDWHRIKDLFKGMESAPFVSQADMEAAHQGEILANTTFK